MSILDRFRVRRVTGVQSGSPRDMSSQAAMIAHGTGFGTSGRPPENVNQAMIDQGMGPAQVFSPGRPIDGWLPFETPWRQWNYIPGQNISITPRGAEQDRPSFATLAALASGYDLAGICIDHIIRDISSLKFGFVPAEGEDGDVESAIATARDFFKRPDGKRPFKRWQKMFLRDILTFDAGTLFKVRNRAGKLLGVRVVSGDTVLPYIDFDGEPPSPPAPAYAQIIQGVPYSQMTWDDVVYEPINPYPGSPYGIPPLEHMLLSSNTDMRLQMFFLEFFTAGSIPDTWMKTNISNAAELARLQDRHDARMVGDQAQRRGVYYLPEGSEPIPAKEAKFDREFALHLMRKTCAAFGVTPQDLGITLDVNRANGETQVDIQYRTGIVPIVEHLSEIYTSVLQDDLGLPVEFQFDTGGEVEDRLQEAQANDLYIRGGVVSPDEIREKVFGFATDNDRPVGRFLVDRTGVVPLAQLMATQGTKIDPETFLPDEASVAEKRAALASAPTPIAPTIVPGNQPQPAQPSPPQEPPVAPTEVPAGGEEVTRAELRRWRQNARSRVKAGKAPRVFVSDTLDAPLVDRIWRSLQGATTVADVDEVFAEAGEGQRPFARSRDDLWAAIYARHLELEQQQQVAFRRPLRHMLSKAVAAALRTLKDSGLLRAAADDEQGTQFPKPPPEIDADALMAAIEQAFSDISETALGDDLLSAISEAEKQATAVGNADARQLLSQAAGEHVQAHPVLKQTALSNLRDRDFDPSSWLGKMGQAVSKSLANRVADAAEKHASYDDLLGVVQESLDNSDGDNGAYLILNHMIAGAVADESDAVYRENGTTQVDLLTAPDAEEDCTDIAAANPWDIEDAPDVPVHYRCRCSWAPHI